MKENAFGKIAEKLPITLAHTTFSVATPGVNSIRKEVG